MKEKHQPLVINAVFANPMMSSQYYLPLRHYSVAKAIYLEHTKKNANAEVKIPK